MVKTDREPKSTLEAGMSPQFDYWMNVLEENATNSRKEISKFLYVHAVAEAVLENEDKNRENGDQNPLGALIRSADMTSSPKQHLAMVEYLHFVSKQQAADWKKNHPNQPDSFIAGVIERRGTHASLFFHKSLMGAMYREFLDQKHVPEEKRQPAFIFSASPKPSPQEPT